MKSYALAFLVSFCASAQEAPKPQFTARELFYSAAQTPPAAPAAAPASKPAAAKKKTAKQAASKTKPAPAPSTPPAVPAAAPAALTDGARIIPAVAMTAPAPTAGPALGMRYTILKRMGDEMVEVAPNTVFHAGDRIQFSVQTNGPGYLYIVSQGSSGAWRPMFPSPEVEDGNNRVDGFHTYAMPPKSRLVFDEQAGTEKIFIVLSREPEPNLENIIYSLQAPKAKPAAQPEAAPKQLLVASIDDGVVGRLRNTYARDLIVEKVDENTPGDKKEKAVYVVNPTGSGDSRVVADLRLVHQ
jgi:hypothetical protein